MRKIAWSVGLLVVGIMALASPVQISAQDKPEAAAQKTAESWLALIDTGKYAESWDAAAGQFKAKVTEEQWKSALHQVRYPLGAVKSRTLSRTMERKSLPGVPDAEYVVMQFATSFEYKQAAVETVTAQLDQGKWRIAGYFIK